MNLPHGKLWSSHTPVHAGSLLSSVNVDELRTRFLSGFQKPADSSLKLCFVDTVAARKEFDFYFYIALCFLLLLPASELESHSIVELGQGSQPACPSLPNTGAVGAHCR